MVGVFISVTNLNYTVLCIITVIILNVFFIHAINYT